MNLFISAGEASGDALGASLLRALEAKGVELSTFGMGGEAMAAQGFEAIRDAGELGVVGFAEVVRHIPRLFRLVDDLTERAIARKPDLAVLIDVPDFNLRVARKLTAAGIPCVFYVGPSVWAWRPWRAKAFAPHARRMLVLFPFEVDAWKNVGVDVVCVGHPLCDEISEPRSEGEMRRGTLAWLPGSRGSELQRHLPTMAEAARPLVESGRIDRIVLPVAPGVDPDRFTDLLDALGVVELVGSSAEARRAALGSAELVWTASGTASLEVALLGRPQVIVYAVHPISYAIGKPLARVQWLGLPNLVLGREAVPELIQSDFDEEHLLEASWRVLDHEQQVASALSLAGEVRAAISQGDSGARAAQAVLEALDAPA